MPATTPVRPILARPLAFSPGGEVWLGTLGRRPAVIRRYETGQPPPPWPGPPDPAVLSRLRHPSIERFLGLYEEPDGAILHVFTRILGDDLAFRRRHRVLSPDEAMRSLIGGALGLRYLHRNCPVAPRLHGDVAPGNLLLPESGSGILVDVRCAKPAHSGGQTRYSEEGAILLGTLPYLAPEVLEGQPVTEVAEVHALALTILASMHGRLPWSGARSPLEVLGNTERSSAASLATGTDLPGQIVDILAAMLDEIPGNRPSAAEVVLQFRRARSRED